MSIHAGTLTVRGEAPDKLEIQRRGEPHVTLRHGRPDLGSKSATGAHVGATSEINATPSDVRAHVGAKSKLDLAVIRAQAKDALVGLGWTPAIACAALDDASAQLIKPTLEALIREALRRCPKPVTRGS